MIISSESYENKFFSQVMPFGHKYDEINMKLEEEEEEESEEIEELKEKQKRLKEEILKKKLREKEHGESDKTH